ADPVEGSSEPDYAAAGIKPSRLPLIAGLVLIAVLTAGGVVFFSRGSDSRPQVELVPPPPITPLEKLDEKKDVPAVKNVKFSFKSVPDHAEVFDGDVMIGTTPFAVTREKGQVGEYRFVLAGFKPASKKIRFEEDTGLEIQLEKEPAKQAPKESPKDPPKDPPKDQKEPRPTRPVGTKPVPKPLKNDPYGDVKELKDLPD
ncbi:MAG: hypothetical protein H6Q89_1272, partial [Myxococcaceae bacterium]|nr:hypothetical protein [Myxococcaceae bacterium]